MIRFLSDIYRHLPAGQKWQIITAAPGAAYLIFMCRVFPGFRDQMVTAMEMAHANGDPLAGSLAALLRR